GRRTRSSSRRSPPASSGSWATTSCWPRPGGTWAPRAGPCWPRPRTSRWPRTPPSPPTRCPRSPPARGAAPAATGRAGRRRHLTVSHALLQRWQNDKVLKGRPARVKADVRRALDYVRQHKGTAWGWALLCLLQDRAREDKALHAALADCFPLFEDMPGLRY